MTRMIILIKMPTRMINLKNRMCILIGPNHPSRNPFLSGFPWAFFFCFWAPIRMIPGWFSMISVSNLAAGWHQDERRRRRQQRQNIKYQIFNHVATDQDETRMTPGWLRDHGPLISSCTDYDRMTPGWSRNGKFSILLEIRFFSHPVPSSWRKWPLGW